MPSTYTVNLGIEKIATGEQSGTWGDTTNTNLDLIDEAVNGVVVITLASAGTSGSPNTLAITNGTSSNGRNKYIEFTDGGDLGATAYVQLTPNDAEKVVHIRNNLSGSRSILIFQGTYNASNDFEIPNGADVVLKFDGAGAGAVVSDVNVNLTPTKLTTATVDINGGTIDSTTIGGSTPAAGTFTSVSTDKIQAIDSAGVLISTDDGTTRIQVQDDGDVKIDGTTLVVDASANNVGIGTSSPTSELTVNGVIETINGTDIDMDGSASGQLRLDGDGFSFAIALNSDGANLYTNSSVRDLIFGVNETERMRIDSSGNVGIGTSSPNVALDVDGNIRAGGGSAAVPSIQPGVDADTGFFRPIADTIGFATAGTEQARLNSGGDFLINKTGVSLAGDGHVFTKEGIVYHTNTDATSVMFINRAGTDGSLIRFFAQGSLEGFISVSGSTVTYSGGHLGRWSQLPNNTKDESIVKGTVMTNLDEMCAWEHDAVEAQDAVYDEEGNLVSEAVEAQEAYTEDNEQLNKMAVSSVEGDPNVAGVFVSWDEDDDFNDMTVAMTGDMVIRIAQGTTVQRGDLLMSAGDGTAKPQDDDIVRSKTIAKVTSTHVSHTYDDGSYLVPCVLMAC